MRYALAGCALLGVLALTACGSGVSLTPVAKAADKTAAKSSEHVTYTGRVDVAGQSLTMAGSGDFQNAPQLGQMTMTMSGGGKHIQMDAVMQKWTIYMRSSLFQKALPAGKTWLSIDLQKAGKTLGLDFSQFSQQSPADAFSALKKAGSVTKVGEETIDGQQTTHYHAVIDFSKVPNGAAVQKITHLKSAPVDVWIGSDGLVRRFAESYTTTAGGQSTSTSMTMDFTNYGEQVNVQVPPASETLDMTKLGG